MRLSTTLLSTLRTLLQGESVPQSRLREDMLHDLLQEGLLIQTSHGSRRTLRAADTVALLNYLDKYEELRGIDIMQTTELSYGVADRASQAKDTGNSKLVQVRSCPGFMVNSYEPIQCTLNGGDITIQPPEGTMMFIADWQTFRIAEDVLIVGIENMENFRRIRQQRYLFDEYKRQHNLHGQVLFFSRYPQSTDLRQWLSQIPNHYLHFGDYDLAGLHIYETEFYNHLGARASFLVPNDIEQRLQNGSAERYNTQYQRFKNFIPQDSRLLPLFEMIHRYHRCYDQEGYIISD